MEIRADLLLEIQIRELGWPRPRREYRFDPVRQWRFDFAWPRRKWALEIEGGIWTAGRHVRGLGYQRDLDKYNAAVLAGWRVLRVSAEDVLNGEALRLISLALHFGGSQWERKKELYGALGRSAARVGQRFRRRAFSSKVGATPGATDTPRRTCETGGDTSI